MRLTILAYLALSCAALAQELPAVHAVVGVTADDALNIRAEPAAGAAIVGTIAFDAMGVEVVRLSDDGAWGMVGTAEGNGWVAMRFLAAEDVDPAGLPRPMRCFGTEPFWTLTLDAGGGEWITPDGAAALTVEAEAAAPNGWFVTTTDPAGAITRPGIILREACSDGMSDRIFGLSLRLFETGPNGNVIRSGCCTMDSRPAP